MAIAQTLPVASAESSSAARLRKLEVKKASASKGFDRQWEDPGWRRTRKQSETSAERLSQSGTEWIEPLWSGPRLRAPFVAQLLGQLLPSSKCDSRGFFRAYHAQPTDTALFLNDLA
jgi:hypothetical protein